MWKCSQGLTHWDLIGVQDKQFRIFISYLFKKLYVRPCWNLWWHCPRQCTGGRRKPSHNATVPIKVRNTPHHFGVVKQSTLKDDWLHQYLRAFTKLWAILWWPSDLFIFKQGMTRCDVHTVVNIECDVLSVVNIILRTYRKQYYIHES